MSEPTARTALRDQIIERAAEWAYAYPISSNAICQTDDRAWRLARIWGEQIARIAVMPVVEAETAALRQRIEEVEDQRDQALAWQDTAERRLDHTERIADALEAERDQSRRERDEQTQRAEEAERERDVALAAADPFKIDRVKSLTAAMTRLVTTERDAARKRAEEAEARNRQYDTAIAAERKGRLAAEAAVRRALAVLDQGHTAAYDLRADVRTALTIEQPEETP